MGRAEPAGRASLSSWSLQSASRACAASMLPATLQRGSTCGDHRRSACLRAGMLCSCWCCFRRWPASYIGQVLMLVGLYILMGMGLNLEVGLAGLLDLGFVAFFAVGAYTTALLTADSPHALDCTCQLSGRRCRSRCCCRSCVGVLFGVAGARRARRLSRGRDDGPRRDRARHRAVGLRRAAARRRAGRAANPEADGSAVSVLGTPVQLFYLTLVASAVAAFVAWRLENSRLGRAWMALRDDEDVAQALGINLVRSKLLAYGLGAAFAGLAGSIFAVDADIGLSVAASNC